MRPNIRISIAVPPPASGTAQNTRGCDFYEASVAAKAASLRRSDGGICAKRRRYHQSGRELIHSAIAKAARSRWSKLPEPEYACIEQKLQERGDSVQALIKRGISPNDSCVAKIRSQCQGASASATFQKLKDQAYRRSEQDTLITASDYKDCEKLCRESSSCTALTHFRAEKICRLMPSATELTADEGADSALRIEPSTGSIALQRQSATE